MNWQLIVEKMLLLVGGKGFRCVIFFILEVGIMMFSEKLNLLRKNRGYTQEELTEKICVSRQAILIFGDIHEQ